MNDDQFINIVQNSNSMAEASLKVGMSFSTFKRKAQKLKIYKPNQGGKGLKKPYNPNESNNRKFLLKDVLDGKFPQYQTLKLKKRLIDENILEDKCCKCGWNGKRKNSKYTTCELHHKDGNSRNHKLENLQILCPNCHSLTDNFRFTGKKVKEVLIQ